MAPWEERVAKAAVAQGNVICFRCRRALAGACPRCAPLADVGADAPPAAVGAWLAGAVLLGSILGAALSLVH
jgi:hypothetical protein